MRLLHARHDHDRRSTWSTARARDLDERTIRHELEGNICRCTGYHNIVKAVQQGARDMAAPASAKAAE